MRVLKVLSLFSGAGGMALGLERVKGVSVKVMVDRDPACCQTLRANFKGKSVVQRDVRNLSARLILESSGLSKGEIDLITGGPPCRSFSRSYEGRREGLNDEHKGGLILEFARMVDEFRPCGFIFENVPGLVSSNDGQDLSTLLDELSGVGDGDYSLNWDILNAADYGVPQKRRRLFVLGLRGSKKPEFPETTHAESPEQGSGQKPYKTSGDAIGDLDDGIDRSGAEEVGGRWGHLLDGIPPGENYQYYTERRKEELGHDHEVLFEWRSRFWTFLLKLDPDEPSTTIQANPGPYVGPFHWRNRPLTVLEKKRLMTIPDEFEMRGSQRQVEAQIGNAVPPDLAERLGEAMRDQILSLKDPEPIAKRVFRRFQALRRRLPARAQSAICRVERFRALFA